MAELALKRLLKTRRDDATFAAKLAILEDLVLHHAEQEEEDLFPAVEAAMAEEELEQLGAQMERAFASAKAEGFAALVPQGFAQTSADVARKQAMRPNGSAQISERAPR